MAEQIEILSLNLRFENYRLKSRNAEEALFFSIANHGIRDSLQGNDTRILLNGFKRYRCEIKFNIGIVPYNLLSNDGADGIMKFIRISCAEKLELFEQARLIDEFFNKEVSN
jgi:hypothetical protein